MAEKEKEKEKLEGQEQETEQEEVVKKPAKKLPLIIGVGVLILAILVSGGIFAVKVISTPADASESATDEEVVEVVKEESAYVSTGLYFSDFDAFITVLRQSEEYHFTYLKFVPKFEISSAKVSAEMGAKLPLIEDKINSVMTDLEWNSIKSERGRERMGEKLTEKLNGILESGKIIKTYFTTFVAQ